jgi:hypothetical protein
VLCLSAILILPVIIPNGSASTDNGEDIEEEEDLEEEEQSQTTGQQNESYQSDLYGFSIEYPSGWELYEPEVNEFTESIKEDDLEKPWDTLDDVCFHAPDKVIEGRYNNNPMMPASLCIAVLSLKVEEYLDTNDMTVKTRIKPEMTARDMAEGYLTQGVFPGDLVKSEETAFGTGNYSAWQVDTQRNVETPQYGIANDYNVGIYSIVGGKIYRIEYWAIDLAVPEYLPILQKMVDSFHITE